MEIVLNHILKNVSIKKKKNTPIGDPSKFNNGLMHPLVVVPNKTIGDPSKFNNGLKHPLVVVPKK